MELGLHRRVGAGDGLYCGNVSDAHSRRRQRLFLGRSVRLGCGAVAVRIGLSARDDRLFRRGVSADPGDLAGDGRNHLVLQPRARRQGARRDQCVTAKWTPCLYGSPDISGHECVSIEGPGSIAGSSYKAGEAAAQATAQSERTRPWLFANRFQAISEASMMSARLENAELGSQ